jgi:hypothetical protein
MVRAVVRRDLALEGVFVDKCDLNWVVAGEASITKALGAGSAL